MSIEKEKRGPTAPEEQHVMGPKARTTISDPNPVSLALSIWQRLWPTRSGDPAFHGDSLRERYGQVGKQKLFSPKNFSIPDLWQLINKKHCGPQNLK